MRLTVCERAGRKGKNERKRVLGAGREKECDS